MSEDVTSKVRLDPDEYERLEQMFPAPELNTGHDGVMAAHLLGIQRVLAVLREGWVIERR